MLRSGVLGICLFASIGSVVLPLSAQAQKPDKVYRLAVLCGVQCVGAAYVALSAELTRLGWVEGRNLTVDIRGAAGDQERLPALASELVGLKPDVVVAVGPAATRAAKNATGTTPIVMVGVADPVRIGLVQSLARPGGNITGLTTLVAGGFGGKQLELLTQVLPGATRIAALINPKNEMVMSLFPSDVPPAAARLGIRLQVVEATSPAQLEAAIQAAVREGSQGLLVFGDPMFHTPPQRLPEMVARAGLPAMYLVREVANAGGLMSYGPNNEDVFRRSAGFIDRILKGMLPADLPIEQPAKFQFVVNLKTAKALGLTIPSSVLVRADEVIR